MTSISSAPLAGPLAGRRVVVTRAAAQADDLAEMLREAGAEPVIVPLIEIVEPDDGGCALAEALGALTTYDWLVVTSPNGAVRVSAALAEVRSNSQANTPQANRLQVAAVGSSTAAALSVPADLVATTQSAEGLLAVFPDGPGRILITQAESARPTMASGLRDRGWEVDVVVAYRTTFTRPSAGDMLRALSADAVLFASGSAAVAWHQVFGLSTPPLVVAIGPSAALAATEIGLKIDVVATDHSLGGMLDCLLTYLRDSD